jgi:hypothetical protein
VKEFGTIEKSLHGRDTWNLNVFSPKTFVIPVGSFETKGSKSQCSRFDHGPGGAYLGQVAQLTRGLDKILNQTIIINGIIDFCFDLSLWLSRIVD